MSIIVFNENTQFHNHAGKGSGYNELSKSNTEFKLFPILGEEIEQILGLRDESNNTYDYFTSSIYGIVKF